MKYKQDYNDRNQQTDMIYGEINTDTIDANSVSFGQLFGQRSTTYGEYTGAPPVTFNTSAHALESWSISGNTIQNGTPTPENPITPAGVGDVVNGVYTIPIIIDTTTPIYLGEVETERKIGKLVLTGGETWYVNVESDNQIYNLRLTVIPNQAAIMCNAFKPTTWGAIRTTDEAINVDWTFAQRTINIRYDAVNSETLQDSLDNFKSYLAQQYANGTPVCVWYVLASSTTGIVNEPLMKIGEYADTITQTETQIQIPTTPGTNTLSIGTTVQPSEIYIKYKE